MEKESYCLKALAVPNKEKILILANGTKMYAKKLNDCINDLLEIGNGIDAPLVLAALELHIRALRPMLPKNACEIADRVNEKIIVEAVNLAELMKQVNGKEEKNEGG